jgi:hypothetical protein
LALLLFLTHSAIYYYAGEFKQYSAELFWSGYALWYFERFMAPRYAQESRRWALLCVGWLLPLFFSITYSLVIFAIGACFFIPSVFRAPPSKNKWIDIGQLLFLTALFFVAYYRVDIRFTDTNMLNSFWGDCFVSGSSAVAWCKSLVMGINHLIGRIWFNPLSWIYTILALLGGWSIIKRN